jgi:hypothetical protein
VRDGRAPIPKSTPYIVLLFLISTIALNLPLLKLYDCLNFTLNNTNKFTKGQGYMVLKFRLKTNIVGTGVSIEAVEAKLVYILPYRLLYHPFN